MSEKNKNILKDIISYALIILAVVVIRVFIFDPVRVDGPSMNNTLIDGDIVILNKFQYRKQEPERYDIVVVKIVDPSTNTEKKIIKRIIGLPNEYVEIKDNKVYANGELLDSSFVYLDENTKNNPSDFKMEDIGLEKIPGNQYLVLGDNRGNSLDSRYKEVGTITKDQIVGKAAIRIWPLNKVTIIKHKK